MRRQYRRRPDPRTCTRWCGSVGRFLLFERETGHVVYDAQREAVLRSVLGELVVYGENACGRRILGTETVTAADNVNLATLSGESGNDVEEQRFTQRAGFLGSVKNGNLLCGSGDGFGKLLCAEGSVQTNLDKTDLFTLGGQIVDDFLGNVADGAHSDDNTICVGSAVVVEQLVVGAELGVDFVHVLLDDLGHSVVVLVASLTMLEEDVAVFVGTAHDRALGVERTLAERFDSVHVAHFLEVGVVPGFNLLDFVGGTETVEEVDERHSAFDSGEVGNSAQVHNFLGICFGEHCKTGLTASVDVGVVTEDVQRMRSDAACGNMEHAGKQLTRNFVHIGDHQQKTLRCSVGRGERTGGQGTVYRTCGTGFGLHFGDFDGRTEDVFLTLSGPLVNVVCHRAGGGNGIDTGYFGKCVGDICRRIVTVHSLFLSNHWRFILSRYRIQKLYILRPQMILSHLCHKVNSKVIVFSMNFSPPAGKFFGVLCKNLCNAPYN